MAKGRGAGRAARAMAACAGVSWSIAGCSGSTEDAGHARGESVAKASAALDDWNFSLDPNPDLANPERGVFYGAGDEGEPDIYTLAEHALFLGSVCNQDLAWFGRTNPSTSSILRDWAEIAVAERGNGRKVIFRPRYDTEGAAEGMPNGCGRFEADSYTRLQNHAQAIGDMLADAEIKPIIAFIQMGYLGSWGEWNTSGSLPAGGTCHDLPFGSCARDCVEACRQYSPVLLAASIGSDRISFASYVINTYRGKGVTRPVELRRPEFFRDVEATFGPPSGSMGFHNDCFMRSASDGGTFSHLESDFSNYGALYPLSYPGQPDTSAQSAKNYMQAKAPEGSQGGESCPSGDPANDPEDWRTQDVPARLNADSFRYLHATWAPEFRQTMIDARQWDTIKSQLGYRFQVTHVLVPDTVDPGAPATVSVDVYNSGFGRLTYDRNAYIVLTGPGNYVIGASDPGLPGYTFVPASAESNENPRSWDKGAVVTFSMTFPAPSPGGTYSVGVYVPDPDCVAPGACDATTKANYAIKFATLRNGHNVASTNTDGINQLEVGLSVGPAGPDLTELHQRIPLTIRPDLCLDTQQGGTAWGTPTVLGPCYDSSARWVYDRVAKTIVHQPSQLCLDIAGADPSAGATVQIWGCNGGANQQWTFDRTTRTLTSGLGTALDVQWGYFQATTPVWSWPVNGGDAQQWWADQPFDFQPQPQSECGFLHPGEGLMPYWGAWSCDSRFMLWDGTQADGTFRLDQMITYDPPPPPPAPSGTSVTRWEANQWYNFPGVVVMQGDGNLVLYDTLSGRPMWASTDSVGHYGVSLSIKNDGNLVIYDFDQTTILWQSGSCCY
jgi:hypothetical protein